MPDGNSTERFVQLLIGCQHQLTTYIGLLLGDPGLVGDVLQETNLVLWRKAAEFDESRDFTAWACGIARFQVMACVRDAKRDRHLFSEQLIDTLAETAGPIVERLDPRNVALDICLEKLSSNQREMLKARYTENKSIAQMADASSHTATSIAKQLSRIRQSLLNCIRQRLAAEARP